MEEGQAEEEEEGGETAEDRMEAEGEEYMDGVTIISAVGNAADVEGAAVDVDTALHTETVCLNFAEEVPDHIPEGATPMRSPSQTLPREICVPSGGRPSPCKPPQKTPVCLLWRFFWNAA